MSTRDTILSTFQQVAADQGRKLVPLSDDTTLVDCGLDSLSFAIVVSLLEESLAVDPFSGGDWVDFPVTYGDFVRLYEGAIA